MGHVAVQKIEIPEPDRLWDDPWSWSKLGRLLATFGPAAIVASVAIGAGETILVVRAGAWAGYGLLWLVLLSVLAKGICVTYLLGRYTAISGEPLGQRLVKLPGPRGWLLILILFLELAAAGPLWAAIARPCGELIHFLLLSQTGFTDLDPRIISTLFIMLALVLSLLLTYDRLEKQQLVICSVLVLGTILGTVLVRPDLGAAASGLLSFGKFPQLLDAAPQEFHVNPLPLFAVTFGYVGGSVLTYSVYADWISLHRWGMTGHPQIDEIRRLANQGQPSDYLPAAAEDVARVKRSVAPLRWDVGFGAVVLLVVSISFMVAGAAVLQPRVAAGEIDGAFQGWSLLTDQGHIWKAIHPQLVWVYYVCVLFGLWGTLQAYPDIYARGITEYGRAIAPTRKWSQPSVQAWVCVYVFFAATAVLWSNWNFHLLTLIVAFLATNLGVAIAMLAALYLNFQLPRAYRTRWWMLSGGILSAVMLLAASAITGINLWQKVQGFFS